MTIRNILLALLAIVGFVAVGGAPASAQASRTWVSGVGDDVNPCSRTAPCKTFAGAISKTAANGTINCIDPGGFGAVTIIKSMTIDCESQGGGILAASTNGIIVNGANIVVKVRNLAIEGFNNGFVGVNILAASAVYLDNVAITQFNAGNAAGVRVANASGTLTDLFITNSKISDSGSGSTVGGGVVVQPAAGGNVRIALDNVSLLNNTNGLFATPSTGGAVRGSISNSLIAGNNLGVSVTTAGTPIRITVDRGIISANGTGISAAAGAGVVVDNSTLASNTTGLAITGAGTIQTFGTNRLVNNNVDGAFTLPVLNEN